MCFSSRRRPRAGGARNAKKRICLSFAKRRRDVEAVCFRDFGGFPALFFCFAPHFAIQSQTASRRVANLPLEVLKPSRDIDRFRTAIVANLPLEVLKHFPDGSERVVAASC